MGLELLGLVAAAVLGLLVSGILLVLFLPVRYEFGGTWRDKAAVRLAARLGPAVVAAAWGAETGSRVTVYVCGLRVRALDKIQASRKEHGPSERKSKGGRAEAEAKEKRRSSLPGLAALADRRFMRRLLETAQQVVRSVAPRVCEASGVLGFEDPYYTGLLAAARSVFPRIGIVPEFAREVRDVCFRLEGRIILAVLVYHAARFALSGEARPVWKQMLRQRKAGQKLATGRASPVYK